MKNKAWIPILIIILAAVGVYLWFFMPRVNENAETQVPVQEEQTTSEPEESMEQATGPESEMTGYTNDEFGFSLEYSANFLKVDDDDEARMPWSYNSERPGRRLFTLQLPKEFMMQTNFADASITVGVSADSAEVSGCTIGDTEPATTRSINGTTFTELNFSDAGVGNLYTTKSYRTLRDGVCLALEATVHSTNLANYSPEQGIVAFDKTIIDAALDEVIASFNFKQ